MSFIEIDLGLLLSTAVFFVAALVLLRLAEARARRLATERARYLMTGQVTHDRG